MVLLQVCISTMIYRQSVRVFSKCAASISSMRMVILLNALALIPKTMLTYFRVAALLSPVVVVLDSEIRSACME